jgi:DeoR family suf operon transcriptional repressor
MIEPEVPPQLAAHKGLRRQILLLLKRAQPLGAKDLAHRLSVSPNAVRHHLKELEAEGLIDYGREQRGVGAPTHLYRLSHAGEALFPKLYEGPLTRLLEHVVAKEGRSAAVAVLQEQYEDLARRLQAELAALPPPERVAAVASDGRAGYMAEWSEAQGKFRTEHNCHPRPWPSACRRCAKRARFFASPDRRGGAAGPHCERLQRVRYSLTFERSAWAAPTPPRGSRHDDRDSGHPAGEYGVTETVQGPRG